MGPEGHGRFSPPPMLKIESPAKLNLVLEVLGKRPDGFHEIRSVMQTIDLCDEIIIEEHPASNHIELHTDKMACPVDEKNLVWFAVQLLREKTSFDKGLQITINKHIPIGGGLGGGSSNSGTVILALVHNYALKISDADLWRIAGRIGSDVAF
ncbi:MAG: 4-(cytidine 5'-diphospho)-2-C-methyl-D-erythritol kinase, partial [Candidatus Coatesbacteria bacterium]|nr:4-(cytidine 5'-diphospho)-2-C-methyl-D-erythritol kinase [Candidatus Coatesbacteria bacterium]